MTAHTVTICKGSSCDESIFTYVSYFSYVTSADLIKPQPTAQKPVKRAYGDQVDRAYLKRKKGRQ